MSNFRVCVPLSDAKGNGRQVNTANRNQQVQTASCLHVPRPHSKTPRGQKLLSPPSLALSLCLSLALLCVGHRERCYCQDDTQSALRVEHGR